MLNNSTFAIRINNLKTTHQFHSAFYNFQKFNRGSHGCDRMVVGFTITYTISAYHH